jgi:hypothetical protein
MICDGWVTFVMALIVIRAITISVIESVLILILVTLTCSSNTDSLSLINLELANNHYPKLKVYKYDQEYKP